MHFRSQAASLLILAALIAAPSSGDPVVIAPLKDNTLYEDPNGTLSNGQSVGVRILYSQIDKRYN